MRIACLLVPDLPLAAELRAEPELVGRPLAIASGPGPRAEIVAVSPEAGRQGVRCFTSVVHARAACSALCVRVASPALQRAARETLLDVALSFSPRAAEVPHAGGPWAAEAAVHLDASGVQALFQSERGFATALAARSRAVGLHAAVAIASSRSVSLLAARHTTARAHRAESTEPPLCVLPADREREFLAPLPVDLLGLDDALADALTRFGVHRIGALARLPRASLATRLGPGVLRWMALARGETDEVALPVHASQRLAESIDLEFAVERLEPLVFVLRGLLSRLTTRLGLRGLACSGLELELGLAGGRREARRIGVAAPTRDSRTLLRLVRLGLEARPPLAPVETLTVATRGVPLRSDQLDLLRPAGPPPAQLDPLLAELQALCGSDRVGAPAAVEDHRPDAFGLARFAPHALDSGARPRRPATSSCASRVASVSSTSSAEPPDRDGPGSASGLRLALRALRPAQAARVRTDARSRPVWVESAVASGAVAGRAGPWRTSGHWWSREERFAFDSYDVQIGDGCGDGCVIRLRHDLLRKLWEVDGVYD